MKNFFKKLAFVLALAMVVTAIAPAGKASAAVKPSFKYNKKVLYIGGDATGAYVDTHKFPINNAAGYTVSWKSSAPSVATVDAKSGSIKAVAVGTSTITAKLTNKAGKATTLEAKVFVKQNADKVGVGSTAAVSEMSVGEAVKVNAYRQLGATKVWKQVDKTLVTDYTKWTSSNPAVATVSKWGTVTAVAAGEAVITVEAVQSEGKTVVDKTTFTVKVAAGLTDAKQTGLNTFQATFAGDLSAVVTKDNLKVYSMVGSTPVVVVVKSVAFDATDKTKAVVTTYVDFAKDTEYKVEYKDTNKTFKGVDTSKDAVKTIAIKTTTAVPNVATAVEFKVFDANGIDITKKEFTDRIDVSLVTPTTDAVLDTVTKKITFFAKDKTATVKASYHTYTYGTDFKEITIDATQVITGQPEAAVTVAAVDTFTVFKTGTTPDFAKAKNTISISDANGLYSVAAQTKNSKGDTVKSTDATSKFKFYTSDQTTLIVTEAGGLFPVKEGGASVIVKYDGNTVAAFNVQIGAKRVAYDVQATFDKTTLTSGAAFDKLVLTVEVKDQYGENFPVVASAEYVTGVASVAAPGNNAQTATTLHKTVFEFVGSPYHKAGQYQYKVKAGDQVRYVYFTVDGAKTTVDGHRFSNIGKTVDTALKYNETTDSVAFDMALASYGSNGYKIADIAIKTTTTAAFNAVAVTGNGYYVEILDPENKAVNSKFYTVSGSAITIKPVIGSDGALYKLKTGSYTVKAYSITKATTTALIADCVRTPLTVANFVVNDTQTVAIVTQPKTIISGVFTTKSAFINTLKVEGDSKVIEVKIGDKVVTGKITDITYTGADNTYYVTKLFLSIPTSYTGETGSTYVQEVAVALPFSFVQ